MNSETDDILFGELKMLQPDEGRGPRVSVDTVLLAYYSRVRPGGRVLEMGCAHGAISLILAKRCPGANFDAFDIDPELVSMARKNAELNGLSGRISFFVSDLREHRSNFAPQSYDVVVMNPPYDEAGTSRPSPDEVMARAMHGASCTLSEVVLCARYLLRNGGRFFLVVRANRLGELCSLLYSGNVKPKRVRAVHPKPGRRASVVIVEAVRASGDGLAVEPPLFIYGEDGEYTPSLLQAYSLAD
ncbi:MAG: tRNA1(Val) (adenine(37)-N6)-methyltransferase [Synergistaceae bacterium]|jgi:tRNA1(Val) A37 N6-methylase TrmN6|nr:tRNA1(Val) (adenine(37)-N6)-methyltransferase [Synergistaceae bacterium]